MIGGRQIGVVTQDTERPDTSMPAFANLEGALNGREDFSAPPSLSGHGGQEDAPSDHRGRPSHRHGPGHYDRQVYGGSYGGSGEKSGANYLGSERAARDGVGNHGLTTVDTKAGRITVNKDAAGDLAGAVNDLVEAGAPVGHVGSYADRNIAGSSRKSQHAYGGAMDLFDQSGRGVISKQGLDWIKSHPNEWRGIKQRRNLVGDEDFGDIGHVEWGGPGYGERHYGGKPISQPSASSPRPPGDGKSVKGSWFDDAVTATPGVSAGKTAGIALPSKEGLGRMFEVTGPNGKTVLLPQIDVGPAEWTGRGIDISGPVVSRFGYTKGDFPTDKHFTYRPAGAAATEPSKTASQFDPEMMVP